jgi:hypothetical protein
MPPVWPDSTAFWQDKRVIFTGGSGLLGSFIGDTDLLEPIARPASLGAA